MIKDSQDEESGLKEGDTSQGSRLENRIKSNLKIKSTRSN